MDFSGKMIWITGIILFWLGGGGAAASIGGRKKCQFSAIFNFGDSNSDTGGLSAALSEVPPPYGETFFGTPSGRYCDGRLIIDFIAENLGLPYLDAYLDSIETNFRHGANFAVGGSSILPGGYNPFHLNVQISQFIQLKSRTIALHKRLSNNRTSPPFRINLPRPKDFSKALYTFDIGHNDISHIFLNTTDEQVRASIPNITLTFSQAIQQLYKEGARSFWLHNTGPIGCLPLSVVTYKNKSGNLDQNGCIKPQNQIAEELNSHIKDRVTQLKSQLPHIAITYIDMYSAKYALISHAKSQGFEDPLKFCCGSYNNNQLIGCGRTVPGIACTNPSRLISWDGVHYSEAANLLVSNLVLNGTFSEPPNSISEACFK